MPKNYIAPRYLRYEKEWEIDPSYAEWIAPIKNSKEGAQCKYCGVILVADVTSLDSHATSDLHMSNMPNSNYSFPGAKYKKTFQRYWLRIPAFKDWLEPVKGSTNKARCRFCNTYISARQSSLLRHSSTSKHKKYDKKFKNKKSDVNIIVKTEFNSDQNIYNSYARDDDVIGEVDKDDQFVLVPACEEEIEIALENILDSNCANSNMLDLECEEIIENNSSSGVECEMDVKPGVKKTRYSGEIGYNVKWEENTQFKDWISSVKDDVSRAQCVVCLQGMVANYEQLVAHGNSQRHRQNMQMGQIFDQSELEDVKPNIKKSKLYRYQRESYNDEWEENPLFKDWITRVRNSNEKARCRYCSKVMLATHHQLLSHLKSAKHRRNKVVLWKTEPKITTRNDECFETNEAKPEIAKMQKEWLNDPLFKDWIKFIVDDNSKVECKVCLRRMFATRNQLLNHIGSRLHQRNTADNVQKHLVYQEKDVELSSYIVEPISQQQLLDEDDIYNDPADPFVNNNIRVKVLYRHEWQDDKHLKDWISAVPETDKKAFCNVCNMQIRACYPALRIHARSPHHLNKMVKAGLDSPAIKSVLDPINGRLYNVAEPIEEDEEEKAGDLLTHKYSRLGYQFSWEKDPNFRDWIIRIKKNDHKVGCRYCRSQMRATLVQINTHMASDRHIRMKMFAEEEQKEIGGFQGNAETDNEDNEDQEFKEEIEIPEGNVKKYRRRYSKIWEKDFALKDWIEPVKGYPFKAKCKFCGVMIAAKRTSLLLHSQSTKHIKNIRSGVKHQGPIKEFEHEKKFIHAPCLDTQQKIWAKYCRTYCKSWELNPLFKSWIESVPGDVTRARCKVCHVLLRARLVELKSHIKTWKHAASMANAKNESKGPATENSESNLNVVVAPSRSSVTTQKSKRRITSAGCSLTSMKLVKNVALDLHRTDDTLAPVKCLEKMITIFPAFNPVSNSQTLFVGSGSGLDSGAVDSMVAADPSTVFTIKRGIDPTKKRKRKHDEMTLMVNEVLSTMTRTITPWEFLLYKVSRTTKKSAYKIKNLMAEFELLCQQIKEFTQKLLTPVSENDVRISSTDESYIKVNDSLACRCIGLSKCNYQISTESEKLFTPSLTIPIRFTHQVMQTISNQLKEQEEEEAIQQQQQQQLLQQQQQDQQQQQNILGIENVMPGNLMMLEDGRICQIVDINSINTAATYVL